jgi:hypothetical protein
VPDVLMVFDGIDMLDVTSTEVGDVARPIDEGPPLVRRSVSLVRPRPSTKVEIVPTKSVAFRHRVDTAWGSAGGA